MWIPADNYLDPEGFRKLCGFATTDPIKRAIKEQRLDAINFYGKWMIRQNAIIRVNKRGKDKENG